MLYNAHVYLRRNAHTAFGTILNLFVLTFIIIIQIYNIINVMTGHFTVAAGELSRGHDERNDPTFETSTALCAHRVYHILCVPSHELPQVLSKKRSGLYELAFYNHGRYYESDILCSCHPSELLLPYKQYWRCLTAPYIKYIIIITLNVQ